MCGADTQLPAGWSPALLGHAGTEPPLVGVWPTAKADDWPVLGQAGELCWTMPSVTELAAELMTTRLLGAGSSLSSSTHTRADQQLNYINICDDHGRVITREKLFLPLTD